jgi:hypothetical protein
MRHDLVVVTTIPPGLAPTLVVLRGAHGPLVGFHARPPLIVEDNLPQCRCRLEGRVCAV